MQTTEWTAGVLRDDTLLRIGQQAKRNGQPRIAGLDAGLERRAQDGHVLVTTHNGRNIAGYRKVPIHFKCIHLLSMIGDVPKKVEAGSGFGRPIRLSAPPPMAIAVHTSFVEYTPGALSRIPVL